MARSTQEKEERKLSLPNGHPSAGYVSPDLSGIDGVETLPEDEQKAHDERNQAQEDEAKAVAEAEHKVATEEAKAAADAEKAAEKETAATTTSSSGSKSS